MVTFHVAYTLYGYVTAADWSSALCCSALPVMARDLSSHLVLHAGAFWLPEVRRSGPLVVLVALGLRMGCLASCGPFLCCFRCCSVGSLSLGGFFMLLVCGGFWFVCTQEWLPFGICFFTQLPLVFQGFQVAVRDLAWDGGFFGDIP